MCASEIKYDRQIRIWGTWGQQALQRSHCLILGSNTLASEIIKNLLLSGISSFSIVDDARVTLNDLQTNFFITQDSLDKPRAIELSKIMKNLNIDSNFKTIDVNPTDFVQQSASSVYSRFDVVVTTVCVSRESLSILGELLYDINVFFVVCRSQGPYGVAQFSYKKHYVYEARKVTDLRVCDTFPELVDYFDQFCPLGCGSHESIPWVVILYKCLQNMEKSDIDDFRKVEAFLSNFDTVANVDPESILQARKEFPSAIRPCGINENLKDLFCRAKREVERKQCDLFWFVCLALAEFYETNRTLPHSGEIPDMISETAHFVRLRQIYKSKSEEDAKCVRKIMKRLFSERNIVEPGEMGDLVDFVCRHPFGLKFKSTSPFDVRRLGDSEGIDFDRFDGVGLHCVNSLLGGVVGTEIIKLITKRFEPGKPNIFYDGIEQRLHCRDYLW